jgi:hypothetical protein
VAADTQTTGRTRIVIVDGELTVLRRPRVTQVDRTDEIQRLAAKAIVSIAPADHPLVATARERLAQPAGK